MPSTYYGLHYHIVFSTKHRNPIIEPQWRSELHQYLGGIVNGLDGTSQGVGGIADHVHLLVGLKTTHCLADFLRELKKASSSWIRRHKNCPAFEWQEGYAAFTVSATARPNVMSYIQNQESHHRQRTYREELVEMLQRAGVEYDEKYLD